MKLKDDLLFYIGYLFLIITDMLNTIDIIRSYDNIINGLGYSLIIVFCLIKAIKNHRFFNKKEIILIVTIFVIVSLSCFFSRNFLIFRIFLLAVSFKYISFSDYLKKDLLIKVIITIGLIILPLIGIIPNNILLRGDLSKRYSFGFYHPNSLSIYLFLLVAVGYYLAQKNKNKIFESLIKVIFMPAVFLVIHFLTDSRTVLAMLVIYAIYTINTETIDKIIKNKYITIIIKNQFIIFTFISLFLILLYSFNIPFKNNLDSIFSGRISNYLYYFENYGITFLGNKIPNRIIRGHTMYLDSMYIKMLLNYGIIVYGIVGYYHKKTLKKMFEDKQYHLVFIFTLLSLGGLTDTNMILPTLNVFLLFYFFRNVEGGKEK